MADDLEHFAATVETRLPDAAATARKRAAELRAQADSDRASGVSIPEPQRAGSGSVMRQGAGGGGDHTQPLIGGSADWNDWLPGERVDLGPLDLPSAWEKQAPTLVDLKYMLHQQDFDDPDEKAAAAWLRSSGFSVQRLGRFKRQQGRRSPDARCKKGSREETIEFKAHHGQSAETAAARIAEGSGQSPRVLLQLTREKTWSRADVMRLMIDGITDATAELLEVVVWTPEFVVKWTKVVGPS